MLRESTTQSSITLTQKQRFLVKLLLSSLHRRLATELPKQLQFSSSCLLESWPAGGRRAGAAEGGRGVSWRRQCGAAGGDLATARRSTLGSRRGGGAAVAGGHLGSEQGLAGSDQLLASLAAGHDWGIWNLGTNPPVREGVCFV